MRWFAQYGGYLFIVNTILYPSYFGILFSEYIFYALMFSSLALVVLNKDIIKRVILHKQFNLFLILNLINLLYFLLFDINKIDSLNYLSVRFLMLTLFSSAVFISSDFFENKFLPFLNKFILFLVALGFFIEPISLDGRYSGIFLNPNEFSVLLVFSFAYILFYFQKHFYKAPLLLLLIFLITISGSRAATLALLIPVFIKYKLSRRFFVILIITTTILIIVTPFLPELNAISRILDGELIFENRKLEFFYAYETFKNQYLFGNGLYNYAYINQSLIKSVHQNIDIGAHNGYLAIMVQYGIFFSLPIFVLLFSYTYKIYAFLSNILVEKKNQFIVFTLLYTCFNAFFETVFTGVNYFQTAFFWFCMAYGLKEIYANEEVQ